MSKRMTRVLSLILTLVMFVSVSTPAFAWGGGDLGSGWDREIGEDEIRDFDEPVVEEEEPFDYFQALDAASGTQVTVEAPMGSLPTLAELRAEPVEIEDVREAVESVVEDEADILVALDISFWMNGIEIEPEEPVRVKISAPELLDRDNLTLVHIPDAAEVETIDLIDEESLSFALGANEIAFVANSFSVYAVVGKAQIVPPQPPVFRALLGAEASVTSFMDEYTELANSNAWQIVSGKYVDNTSASKTVRDDNVRIQKNIIPTENENEFKVYLSIDAHAISTTTSESLTKFMEDAMEDNLYVGGSSPNVSASYLDGEDDTAVEGYCVSEINPGSEKALRTDGNQAIQLHIRYNGTILAEPVLHFAVPNSLMLYKLPSSDPNRECDYIMLQPFKTSGGKVYSTADPQPWSNPTQGNEIVPRVVDGVQIYDVYLDLTEMAYKRLLTTVPGEEYSETTSIVFSEDGDSSKATVTDPLGDSMVQTISVDQVDGSASITDGVITWNLSAKPEGSYGVEEGTTTTTMIEPYTDEDGVQHSGSVTTKDWWDLNVAELVYTVKLDVLADGFESFKTYPVNNGAQIKYTFDNWDTTSDPLTLPDPTVKGRIFYVYHSGHCAVEKYPYTNPNVELQTGDYMMGGTETKAKFNLVKLVEESYLYGGYYKAYAGAAAAKDVAGARSMSYTVADQKGTAADGGTPYDAKTANVWNAGDAYTDVKGTEINPQPDKVYYIKEVPNGYIRPYLHYTFDEIDPDHPIKSIYIITASDDANYDSVGYVQVNPDGTVSGTKAMMLKITKPDGSIDKLLTAKSVFSGFGVTRGYLWWNQRNDLIGQAEFTYQPCWKTLDGVDVMGLTERTVVNMGSADTIGLAP